MKLICERSHGLHLPELGCYGPGVQIASLEKRIAELYEDAQIHSEISNSIIKALNDVGMPHTKVRMELPRDKDECFSSLAIRQLAKRTGVEALGDLNRLGIRAKEFVYQFTSGKLGYARYPDIADWKEFFEKL